MASTSLKDKKIQLDPNSVQRLRGLGMNWSCTSQKPFEFRPVTFTASIEGLKPKTFTQAKQIEAIDKYLEYTERPGIIGISSAPNDGQSLLMAAYLMQCHMLEDFQHRPLWHDVTGGFGSSLMENEPVNATMLVLNNIGPDSTQTKKEKFRDILTRYSELPIVVVVNGADAFTFLTREMRKAVSGVVYLANTLVKKSHEI